MDGFLISFDMELPVYLTLPALPSLASCVSPDVHFSGLVV